MVQRSRCNKGKKLMSRPPTPQEIRDTNPNMTMQCDSCYLVMHANADFGTFENALTINMSGGYQEYVDTAFINAKEVEFNLCHKCAHKLMKSFFGDWAVSGWHPRTKDKYCDGWRITE
jgi:hypothetical protein